MVSANDDKTRSWLPSEADKYLPVWVIAAMTLSVIFMTLMMGAIIRDVCAIPGRCAAPKASTSTTTATTSATTSATSQTPGVGAAAPGPDRSAASAAPGPRPGE